MAVTIKKGSAGQKLGMADFLQQLQKDHGEEIGSFGGELVEADRIPTGLFPLDLASAGGFPRGSASTIYGPESSGKTNIVLRAIAMHQLLWPDDVCVFFDIENSLRPGLGEQLGVNTDKLVVIQPNYGEQMVDMAESALLTEDCGIVAIDSLAAIMARRKRGQRRARQPRRQLDPDRQAGAQDDQRADAGVQARAEADAALRQPDQDRKSASSTATPRRPPAATLRCSVEHHPARLRQEPDGHEGVRGHAGRQGDEVRPAQVEVPGALRRGQVHDGDAGAQAA